MIITFVIFILITRIFHKEIKGSLDILDLALLFLKNNPLTGLILFFINIAIYIMLVFGFYSAIFVISCGEISK